jgi:hypothetical protein
VKTYNWGVNNTSQLSTLASDETPIRFEDKGNSTVVEGLEPFIYRFAQDTLTLYSRSPLPSFPLHCSSIAVRYEVVDDPPAIWICTFCSGVNLTIGCLNFN